MDRPFRLVAVLALLAVLVGAAFAVFDRAGGGVSPITAPGAGARTAPGETPEQRRASLMGGEPALLTPLTPPVRKPRITQALIPQYRDGGAARVYRERPEGWQPVAIVMHATGSGAPGSEFPTLARLHAFLARPSARSSAHYGVDRQGRIMQYVPDEYAAFHVATAGWNDISIGIELLNDNTGRQDFPTAQRDASRRLVRSLGAQYGMPVEAVVRHRDVQPEDRYDPPRNFRWTEWMRSLGG